MKTSKKFGKILFFPKLSSTEGKMRKKCVYKLVWDHFGLPFKLLKTFSQDF